MPTCRLWRCCTFPLPGTAFAHVHDLGRLRGLTKSCGGFSPEFWVSLPQQKQPLSVSLFSKAFSQTPVRLTGHWTLPYEESGAETMQRQPGTIVDLPYPSSWVHAEREPSHWRRMPVKEPSSAEPRATECRSDSCKGWRLDGQASNIEFPILSSSIPEAQCAKKNFCYLLHPISLSSSPRVHACGIRHGFDAKCQQRHSRLLPTFLREHRLLAGTLAPDVS